MKRINGYLSIAVLVLAATVTGCAQKSVSKVAPQTDVRAWLLMMQESRQGESESVYRYLITDRYIRIDEGMEQNDFVLFDRQKRIIYNVVHDDASILMMREKKIKIPDELVHHLDLQKNSSNILGRSAEKGALQAFHYQYSYKGEDCYNVVGVKMLMPEVVQALKEYRQVLASELASTLDSERAREDMCDTLISIVSPDRIFEAGLPLREWRGEQFQRFIVDYRWDILIPEAWLRLPDNYKMYTTSADDRP